MRLDTIYQRLDRQTASIQQGDCDRASCAGLTGSSTKTVDWC
ncbi:MAG: hypothetical protein ABI180_09545 [Microcoleus sp.]